jgi:hypothetical protein
MKAKKSPHIVGTRTLIVLPTIPDAASVEHKNALAVRAAANVHGRCPTCGATPEQHRDGTHPDIVHLVFAHEPWCDALTDGDA